MTTSLPAGSRSCRDSRPPGGGPPKTERPESSPAARPIDHHVAGHKAEHPDKPGRPRNDRNHTTPQPLAPHLTKAPVQISGSRGKTASAGGFRRPLFTQDAEPRDVDVLTSLDRTFAKAALVGKPSRRASFGTTGLSGVVVRNGAMHAG
jgi:hypothetical protein